VASVRAQVAKLGWRSGIGPTFPPQYWNATLALLLEPEQMPHPLKKLGSYCATNRKSSVGSHAYTHVTMHEYA